MADGHQGSEPTGQPVRVLIVDSHASYRSALKALLQTEGLEVVADLQQRDAAFDMAAALRPDVTLIDVSPDQIEGLELARRLSALARPSAVVLMSATPPDVILAASARADAFLMKAGITADAIAHAARARGTSPRTVQRKEQQ
jgi:DNA-binding NarL/FixJ family response regulator